MMISYTRWDFGPNIDYYGRTLNEARHLLIQDLQNIKPKHIISIIEKEDHIIAYLIEGDD